MQDFLFDSILIPMYITRILKVNNKAKKTLKLRH